MFLGMQSSSFGACTKTGFGADHYFLLLLGFVIMVDNPGCKNTSLVHAPKLFF
jgi:hypothetical protein